VQLGGFYGGHLVGIMIGTTSNDLLKKAHASDSVKDLAHLKFAGDSRRAVKKGAHWAETVRVFPETI